VGSIEIENPRGFNPELDMEPNREPCMVDLSDRLECTIQVFSIKGVDSQKISLTIDTKFETTTLNLSKEKAIDLAKMLYQKADNI